METKDFRTKTYLNDRGNIHTPGFWECAIDVGYSGVKSFSPNSISSFPSFAVPVIGPLLSMEGEVSNHDIYYRDDNGKVWKVGKCAQDTISPSDPNTASLSIYGRSRYFSPMFKVLSDTALGLAMRKNDYGTPKDSRIIIQTGLPNSYLKSDQEYIKEIFSGKHKFSIKLGTNDWLDYEFDVDINDIGVMPQPLGTLMSISTDNEGKPIAGSEKYYRSRMVIVDPGFGTMDCFPIENKEMGDMETFDNLGMKAVMQRFSQKIFEKYKVDIPIPAIQHVLETGEVMQYDRKEKSGKNVPVTDLLAEANKEIALEAIDKLREVYDDLTEFNYLVLTGGAGAAWEKYFTEAFSGLPNLEIIKGNQNDNLPSIFANVRGYYLYSVQRTFKM